LSLILSPLVRRYTATDIPALLPLLHKNISLNFPSANNITASALDWVLLHSTPSSQRARIFPMAKDPPDLVLVVDCIYNPALVPPLLSTMSYLAPAPVPVLVVVELRSVDVVREFLERWIESGEWEIWRVGGEEGGLLGVPYVAWVGWRTGPHQPTG
jgi:protein N-lysine methyltransferase METTL21D